MKPQNLEPEHVAFKETVRAFLQRDVVPFHAQWERDGLVDREVWRKAGALGLLGTDVPEQFGGGGIADVRYPVLLNEAIVEAGATGLGFPLHNDVVAPYLLKLCDQEQAKRWLPGFCSGELVTAIAMTEPGAGSDLAAMKTNATPVPGGYVLNGAKTFITNGIHADLVVVAAKTAPKRGARGISLLIVERGMAGFTRGPGMKKIGMHAQDTAELYFDDVFVPRENLLGAENRGLLYIAENLPQERLSIAAYSVAGAEVALEHTTRHCTTREAFGGVLGDLQHIRFQIAELTTLVDVSRTYIDACIADFNAGELDDVGAAKAKWWGTDVERRVVDACVQLCGGSGYMAEHPVAKAFADARVHPIYGGTNEIMKETIGRAVIGRAGSAAAR